MRTKSGSFSIQNNFYETFFSDALPYQVWHRQILHTSQWLSQWLWSSLSLWSYVCFPDVRSRGEILFAGLQWGFQSVRTNDLLGGERIRACIGGCVEHIFRSLQIENWKTYLQCPFRLGSHEKHSASNSCAQGLEIVPVSWRHVLKNTSDITGSCWNQS